MRIAFIDDDGMERIAPHVRALGHEAVVFRTGVYDSWHRNSAADAGVEIHTVPAPDAATLIEAIAAVPVDALVSLALLDPYCLRDALVCDYFRHARGLPTLANPVSAVTIANDKFHTKRLLRQNDIAVGATHLVETCDAATAAAAHIGYPLVLKQVDGYSGLGMRLIDNPAQLEHYYRRQPGRLLMEPFLEGIEVSVDVLRCNGVGYSFPLIYKGATDRDLRKHPIYRLRASPYLLPTDLVVEMQRIALRCMDLLGIVGMAGCEFILHREHGPLVSEINPRIAGTASISAAASGIDPHIELVNMVLGRCDLHALRGSPRVAAQVPIRTALSDELRRSLHDDYGVLQTKIINWVPHLGITASLTLAATNPDSLLDDVGRLAACVDIGSAAQELKGILHAG